MPTHTYTVPLPYYSDATDPAQAPASPFAQGPYTPDPETAAASTDPRVQSSTDSSTFPLLSLLKLLFLVLFIILAVAPSHPGWIAAALAGVFMFGLTLKWVAWVKRNWDAI